MSAHMTELGHTEFSIEIKPTDNPTTLVYAQYKLHGEGNLSKAKAGQIIASEADPNAIELRLNLGKFHTSRADLNELASSVEEVLVSRLAAEDIEVFRPPIVTDRERKGHDLKLVFRSTPEKPQFVTDFVGNIGTTVDPLNPRE